LKPAAEDWWVFRKPLVGTVAANMTAHGTGGLNIDGCRIAGNVDEMRGRSGTAQVGNQILGAGIHNPAGGIWEPSSAGRWPANVILDGEAAAMLDAQTGTLTSGIPGRRRKPHETTSMAGTVGMLDRNEVGYADSGGASRFFLRVGSRDFSTDDESCEKTPTCLPIESGSPNRFFYTAKASRSERTHGGDVENLHPTVKPIALMRWLVRLVTPPGGLVLDPFCGSGSTGVGAILEGFNFVGSEADLESAKTSRARLELATLVRVGGVKNPWEDDPAVTVPEGPPSLISSIDDLFGFGE
jgi:site-specific DNA-methyltransferase (adenine-specific)